MKMKKIKAVIASVPRYDCMMGIEETATDGVDVALMELATDGEYVKIADIIMALDMAVGLKIDVCRYCGNPPGPVCDAYACNKRANEEDEAMCTACGDKAERGVSGNPINPPLCPECRYHGEDDKPVRWGTVTF